MFDSSIILGLSVKHPPSPVVMVLSAKNDKTEKSPYDAIDLFLYFPPSAGAQSLIKNKLLSFANLLNLSISPTFP